MKKGKRILSGILVFTLLASLSFMAGCGKEEQEKPIEITLMHGWGGTLKTHNTMQRIYTQFSEENPDIVLKSIPYSDSSIAVEKANDMLAVGKTPDIISTNGLSYYVYNAIKTGMAMDLMPYIKKDAAFAQAIHPSVYETWTTEDGALYTIPDALEVAGYWYNAAHLKKAQVVDENGAVKLPATWEAFFQMVDKLNAWSDDSGEEVVVASMDPIQMSEYLFLARIAGENENGRGAAEGKAVPLEEETVSRTMEDILRLCQSSQFVDNIEGARQNFNDGKSTLYFNGVWESDAFSESQYRQDFQYAAYPSNSGESLSYVSPSSGYVLATQKDERKAEAEIRFLKYMLSERVQMEMAVNTGQAPSNPKIDSRKVEEENPIFGNAISVAYGADIQIKTIWSVWSEGKLQVVRNNCDALRQSWDTTMAEDMTEQLNTVQ